MGKKISGWNKVSQLCKYTLGVWMVKGNKNDDWLLILTHIRFAKCVRTKMLIGKLIQEHYTDIGTV